VVGRGDICWCNLEDAGRRPVIVLTRSEAIPILPRVIVAPITRRIRGIPTEVRLDESDGIDECAINFDDIRPVPRALLGEPIASLAGPRMHEVCRALAITTGCA
jgi:mRNA interferase MazF